MPAQPASHAAQPSTASRWSHGQVLIFSPILPRSAALELRFALVVESTDAFAPVLGAYHAPVGLDLEQHARGKIHLQSMMYRMLRLAHRQRRVRGDSLRRF